MKNLILKKRLADYSIPKINRENMVEVYTSFTEGYDEPRSDIKNVKYDRFKVVALNAKAPKILSHLFVSDISVWVDGNVYLKEIDVEKILGNSDMAVVRHPIRNCLYQEAIPAKERIKHDPWGRDMIDEQIRHYTDARFPRNYGLWFCCMLIRRDNEVVRRFNEIWWAQICRYSYRDQISFPFALSKVPDIKIKTLPCPQERVVRETDYFWRPPHKR